MKSASHFRISVFSNSQILFAVLAWSLLILRFGYRYGTGDQVELLPYTLFLHDSTLYVHDFFIQGLNASVPNERTVMANLLLPFVNHLEVFCFVFQFLSAVVLILGLEKLARRFIKNKYVAWLAILAALIPLNDFALGNVELYSECFQASGLATAIVVWAINLFLDRKYLFTSVLMSLATFIQLLEGLDVMMALCAILLIAVIRKEVSWKVLLGFISVYAFTAGIYLVMIFMQKSAASGISNQELFKILFEFRHPHHFIFSAFPKGKMLVFFAFVMVSVLFFSMRSKKMFQFILIGLAGIIVYAFAVDGLHNVFIGNFQFYKVTEWMKFLGVVAFFGFAEQFWGSVSMLHSSFEKPVLISLSILSWVIILNFSNHLPYKVPFQLFGMKEQDDIISICEKIKDVTPHDAVFIQPFENTELKFYAQRSSYIEFKANVRNRKFIQEWYNRIQFIYSISTENAEQGFTLQKKANENYYYGERESLWIAGARSGAGITHMLVKKDWKPPFGKLILQNNTYAVYQL